DRPPARQRQDQQRESQRQVPPSQVRDFVPRDRGDFAGRQARDQGVAEQHVSQWTPQADDSRVGQGEIGMPDQDSAQRTVSPAANARQQVAQRPGRQRRGSPYAPYKHGHQQQRGGNQRQRQPPGGIPAIGLESQRRSRFHTSDDRQWRHEHES